MKTKMEKKKIVIFGATGLIGQELVKYLLNNYSVIIVTRNTEKAKKFFSKNVQIQTINDQNQAFLENSFAVINLSGENIASKRWTKAQKQKIIDSRINTSKTIIKALNSLKNKPDIYIQASAVGFYPFSFSQTFTEKSEKGNSFLSNVVNLWEKEINNLDKSIRSVVLRTGVVLSKNGGMLSKVLFPMKLYIGGKLGKGNQWISWIHIEDEINAIKFLIENENQNGIFNLVAPNPVTMKDFIETFGKILHRPTFFNVPEFLIKLIFDQMGKETILASQKVSPERLLESGFIFQHKFLESAIKKLLNK